MGKNVTLPSISSSKGTVFIAMPFYVTTNNTKNIMYAKKRVLTEIVLSLTNGSTYMLFNIRMFSRNVIKTILYFTLSDPTLR